MRIEEKQGPDILGGVGRAIGIHARIRLEDVDACEAVLAVQ